MPQRYRHTLSGKLMLLFVVMAALVVISVGATVGWAFRSHFQDNVRPHLLQYLKYIEADLGMPPGRNKAQALARGLSLQIHYFSTTAQWSTGGPDLNLDAIRFRHQFTRGKVEYGFGHLYDRDYLVSRHQDYTLAFSVPRRERHLWLQGIPVLATLILLIVLYHATRRLFAPIRPLKDGIQRIGAGELGHRIDVRRRDELGDLGDSINAMAREIERMLEAKRQLLLAISHELRSPLTRAKVAAAMIDDTGQQTEIQRDLDEMEALIQELLETERLSTGHHILRTMRLELQGLIQEVMTQSFSGHEITLDMPATAISLQADCARLKLLLKNLLANAVQHTPATARPPTLRLERTNSEVKIIIRDHGPGIQAEHLPHLAEPFYRTDAARRRETGGFGLGLYLCKVIAEAHGGALQIDSELGEGTTVAVTLPAEQ